MLRSAELAQELADRLTSRLSTLLQESDDPQEEVRTQLDRLDEADLWPHALPTQPPPSAFPWLAIAGNPSVLNALQYLRLPLPPESFETPGDLIAGILPASGGME